MTDIEGSLKGGVEFGEKLKRERTKIMMYADDLVIVSETSDVLK